MICNHSLYFICEQDEKATEREKTEKVTLDHKSEETEKKEKEIT